ncbi:MAG: molybdopterin-binding protein [Janthinobacterium lividum]
MIFAPVPLEEALGTVLAHTQRLDRVIIKKGSVLNALDLQALREADLHRVVVARLEADDLGENEAAGRLATALQGKDITIGRIASGRCNLHADAAGLLLVERGGIDRINRVHPALTVATLEPVARVGAGERLATIKVIPFAAPAAAVREAERLADQDRPLRLHRFLPLRVGLILTRLPRTQGRLLDSTILTTQTRIAALGGTLLPPIVVGHEPEPVATAIRQLLDQAPDIVLLAGAAATVDPLDVVPVSIVAAGGAIEHFGMPAEPGNLICKGHCGDVTMLVLPSCARNPKANGTDFLLQRLFCRLPVSPLDIMNMGVGGLLREPVSPFDSRTKRSG